MCKIRKNIYLKNWLHISRGLEVFPHSNLVWSSWLCLTRPFIDICDERIDCTRWRLTTCMLLCHASLRESVFWGWCETLLQALLKRFYGVNELSASISSCTVHLFGGTMFTVTFNFMLVRYVRLLGLYKSESYASDSSSQRYTAVYVVHSSQWLEALSECLTAEFFLGVDELIKLTRASVTAHPYVFRVPWFLLSYIFYMHCQLFRLISIILCLILTTLDSFKGAVNRESHPVVLPFPVARVVVYEGCSGNFIKSYFFKHVLALLVLIIIMTNSSLAQWSHITLPAENCHTRSSLYLCCS